MKKPLPLPDRIGGEPEYEVDKSVDSKGRHRQVKSTAPDVTRLTESSVAKQRSHITKTTNTAMAYLCAQEIANVGKMFHTPRSEQRDFQTGLRKEVQVGNRMPLVVTVLLQYRSM